VLYPKGHKGKEAREYGSPVKYHPESLIHYVSSSNPFPGDNR